MGRRLWRRRGLALVSMLAALGLVLAAAPGFAGPAPGDRAAKGRQGLHEFAQRQLGASEQPGEREQGDAHELLEAREWYSTPRLAPGDEVPAAAVSEADAAASRLGTVGGHWDEVTDLSYDSDAHGYRDPVWSNSGGGAGLVGGRMTAMASDGPWVHGGAADGGVWVSHDRGQHWTPTLQSKETLSIGALYVHRPDHSLWVGTGEANTSSDSYAGQGIWRSTNHGRSYVKVGGDELRNALVFRITASSSYVYAATSRGLWRLHSQAPRTSPWQLVLKPDPNPGNTPYNTSFITDVALKPGSGGKQVIAVLGCDLGPAAQLTAIAANGGTIFAGSCGPCNPLDAEGGGFASSIQTNYGGTWHKVTAPNLPNRFVSAVTVEPADAAHVYAVYNGYSRRWIPSAGVGHVFESRDGGATWTDVSGNLPDVPGTDLVLARGHLVLATDNAVYVADAKQPTAWSRFGSDLPRASVNDLTLYPDGRTVVAATHGRGLWRLRLP